MNARYCILILFFYLILEVAMAVDVSCSQSHQFYVQARGVTLDRVRLSESQELIKVKFKKSYKARLFDNVSITVGNWAYDGAKVSSAPIISIPLNPKHEENKYTIQFVSSLLNDEPVSIAIVYGDVCSNTMVVVLDKEDSK